MARFGVRLDNDGSLSLQQYLELGRLAEAQGYEMVWVPEGNGFDSLTRLTYLAAHTRRTKLATGILPIFSRTPMLTAMSAAGLSILSQGRFILGLGVGHRPTVEARDGVPFRQPMARLRETIYLVRRLLAGERVTYEGRVIRVHDASLGEAAPDGNVPIYIAALGPQMLELAGEMADGVLLNWTASGYLEQAVAHVHQGAKRPEGTRR